MLLTEVKKNNSACVKQMSSFIQYNLEDEMLQPAIEM